MNRISAAALLSAALLLSACTSPAPAPGAEKEGDVWTLVLSDGEITLDGAVLDQGEEGTVTVTRDIVYYQDGTDESYGEGSAADMHTAQEADTHRVVTIREAGTYRVSGVLSPGQLAVDLGKDAKRDPEAKVTLILDGVDITCTVAPAVIFYNVYECDTEWTAYDEGEHETYSASPLVDTSAAGANVILADGSSNQVSGSYVARIYKEGTTKKLHKYDGAFYSKMSMNIGGEEEGSGILTITAENEGLDSELHLTVNGGNIVIQAQNDGINTNEDGVSVTTINAGTLRINAGLGAEGDGIDSNGHIVFNGGTVYTISNDRSPDGGIDADGEILINGGCLIAAGTRNDTVSTDSTQPYMELSFASALPAGSQVELEGTSLSFTTEKTTQSIVFSAPELQLDTDYTLTVNGAVQQYTGHAAGGFGGGMGGQPPQPPEGQGTPPDLPEFPDGQMEPPDGGTEPPDRPPESPALESAPPDGQPEPPGRAEEPPDGQPHRMPGGRGQTLAEPSVSFTLTDTVRAFSGISDQVS